MKKRELIRSLVFLLLFISLLLSAVLVFDRKTACDYTTRVRGFYNEPEDSMDVLLFGSSHMYCTISPLVLWEETGLRSYVLATQQQPLAASYYYMKESLELQKPRVLVLEVSMAPHGPDSIAEGTVRDCLDPLPWSRNKLELIKQLVPEGERSSYYFNFLKYHSRWKELSARDLDFSYLGGRDLFRGYIYLTPQRGSDCRELDYSDIQALPLPEENLRLLDDIRALADENGVRLMFMAAPYQAAAGEAGYLKSLHIYAAEHGIEMLDFNEIYDDVGFDNAADFFDAGHLNVYGSAKTSAWLGRFLQDKYSLSPIPLPVDGQWQAGHDSSYGENNK